MNEWNGEPRETNTHARIHTRMPCVSSRPLPHSLSLTHISSLAVVRTSARLFWSTGAGHHRRNKTGSPSDDHQRGVSTLSSLAVLITQCPFHRVHADAEAQTTANENSLCQTEPCVAGFSPMFFPYSQRKASGRGN